MSAPATQADSWRYLEQYTAPPEPAPEVVIEAKRPTDRLDVLGNQAKTSAVNFSQKAALQVGKLPSPGGIGALTLILLILVLVLIPVGGMGETRLQLMYDVLRGDRGIPLPVTSNSSPAPNPLPSVIPPVIGILDTTTPTGPSIPSLPATVTFPLGNFGELPPI